MTTTPKPPRCGLGRGLGSLIPTAPPETNEPSGWAGTPSPNGADRSDVTSPTPPGSDASSPSDASSSPDAAGTVSGAYFAERGIECFYPAVTVLFTVAAGQSHYHVPLLLSPYSYTTYRGS